MGQTGARWNAAAGWEALAAEAFLGIREWRLQHPRATFAEIEQALDARLAALRARLLQDVALASAAATVGAQAPGDRPSCPACGGRLAVRGRETRKVGVAHGQTVTLARDYAVCSACGTGLSPPR